MDTKTQGGCDVEERQTNKHVQDYSFSYLYLQWSTSGISLAGGFPSVSWRIRKHVCQLNDYASKHTLHVSCHICRYAVQTRSDFQAWFFVYSASTSSGSSLDRRIRGSRSALVLSKENGHRSGNTEDRKEKDLYMMNENQSDLEPLKNPLDSFFSQGQRAAELPRHHVA